MNGDDIGSNKGRASGTAHSTTTAMVDKKVSNPPQITQASEVEGHTEMCSGSVSMDKQKHGSSGSSRNIPARRMVVTTDASLTG